MSLQEQLLEILKNATAQKPISFDELLQKSNANKATVQSVLDAMYNKIPYLVNRAVVTRSGIESVVYWPTGHIEKATRQHIVINKSYAPTQQPFSGSKNNPPRRSERPTPPPVVIEKKEEIMQEEATTKSIVDLVISKNQMSKKDIYDSYSQENRIKVSKRLSAAIIAGILKFDGAYVRLGEMANRYLGRKHKAKVTPEPKPAKPFKIVAPAEMQQTAQKVQQNVGEVQQSETNAHKSATSEEVPTFGDDKPAIGTLRTSFGFFKEPAEADVLLASSVEADVVLETPSEAEGLTQKLENDFFNNPNWCTIDNCGVGEKPRVRFAITSDHTIIIQGAADEDIELSPKQTEALVEFIESIAMTIPAHSHSVGGASL